MFYHFLVLFILVLLFNFGKLKQQGKLFQLFQRKDEIILDSCEQIGYVTFTLLDLSTMLLGVNPDYCSRNRYRDGGWNVRDVWRNLRRRDAKNDGNFGLSSSRLRRQCQARSDERNSKSFRQRRR